jgi:hypothetical protein
VAQRICLYLARISPQQTIDHLVYEVSLGLHEDYSATETSFIGGAGTAARRGWSLACRGRGAPGAAWRMGAAVARLPKGCHQSAAALTARA